MNQPIGYARRLGLFSGTMAVIGGIIGSGIFLNPAIVAQRVGTAPLTLGAWILGGVVALLGAFIFGELAARLPRAGGGYVYLRAVFGALPAFLYAWALLLMIATGAIAAVAVTFANYSVALLGLAPSAGVPVAVGAIIVITAINYVGVTPAAWSNNLFTVLKLTALAGLIVAGLALAVPGHSNIAPPVAPVGAGGIAAALATAFVPVLFAYGGWQQTNFIAEELVDAERNLPRALVLGVLGVVAVYLLANVAYLRVLGVAGLAASTAPAADTMRAVMGPLGAKLISAGIVASTFGWLVLVIMVSPRVYQAMAADGLFFAGFARLHPRFRTPAAAILFQGAWTCLLLFTKKYGQLLDYVTFADWIFFGSCAGALWVFRRRQPVGPGFRAPLFPWSVLVFLAAAGYVVAGSVLSNPGNALRGAGLLALGVPVFLYWSRRASGVPRA